MSVTTRPQQQLIDPGYVAGFVRRTSVIRRVKAVSFHIEPRLVDQNFIDE